MPRGNGGIIGPANIPSLSSAKGVWSLSELTLAVRQSIWPLENAGADPYFEYTTLLLPGNGTNGAQNNTFLDGSTNNFTITRNGNTPQGTFSPFSQTGWSNYFDGTGDYLSTNTTNAAWQLGTGDFEIGFWIYPANVTGNKDIFTQRNASGTPQIFLINNVLRYNNALVAGILDATISVAANTWTYCVLSRVSGTTRWFVNGASAGSVADTNNWSSTNSWWVSSSSQPFNGYISNLRLIKGSGVTSVTVPTSPFTGVSGTSFLTCQSNRFLDASSNNFTITPNADARVVAFSPFNPTASWSAATNGGSGYFDGSGDYLSVAYNAAFSFSTGAYCIETWAYSTSTAIQQIFAGAMYCSINRSSTGTNVQGNIQWFYDGSNAIQVSSDEVKVNAWNHLVFCRNGSGNLAIFANGTRVGTVTTSASQELVSSGGNLDIGFFTGRPYLGYMSGFRVIKGSTPYDPTQTSITVPTAPLTAITNTSLLLNFTNAGVYDATSKNDLETVGNAQISTTQSKWGGSSISFDGTGDWLLIPDQPPQRIGTGNFTIEMWVYRNSSGTYGLAGKGTGTTGWLVSLNSSNQVVFTYGSSTITSSGTVSATTWTHIAVVREGTSTNQTKIYIGGSNDGTGTVSTDFNQTNSMYIGADRTGGSAANAYVQDVRITNYARYTANFTAPTAPFLTF
jgi:hypothetical protein